MDIKPELLDLRCSVSREETPGCLYVSQAPTQLSVSAHFWFATEYSGLEIVSRITRIASLI